MIRAAHHISPHTGCIDDVMIREALEDAHYAVDVAVAQVCTRPRKKEKAVLFFLISLGSPHVRPTELELTPMGQIWTAHGAHPRRQT